MKNYITKEYLKMLLKQYMECRDIHESKINENEFIKYLDTLLDQTDNYRKYLSYLGIEIDTPYTIEIDKGYFDSISLGNTLIVSRYADTLGLENSSLLMVDNELMIHKSAGIFECIFADTLVTHNPYSPINTLIFNLFAQTRKIAVGVFGSIYDKNKMHKIKEIKRLNEKIFVPLEIHYDTHDDNYFMVVINKHKILEKKLIRGR